MGFQASRLADWETALQVGRTFAGPGIKVPAVGRARMREDLSEFVAKSEDLIKEHTGMSFQGFRSRAWVMSRTEWMRANLAGMQRVIEPLAARMLEDRDTPEQFKRKAVGSQIGVLIGYVGKKVLGQYDPFLPADDEGLLYFVGPNIAEVESRYGLPQRDFRLWVAIHEVTHRVQFGHADWLQNHLTGMVDSYLGSISLDTREIMGQLKRAADEIRASGDVRGAGGLFALLSDEQRQIFQQMQGVMSLLEGHASYVMNTVARDHVADLDRLKRTLSARRRKSGLERGFQRAIGFDQKIRQYEAGERFVRVVIDKAGMDTFNSVWRAPEFLPSMEEIEVPESWLRRILA